MKFDKYFNKLISEMAAGYDHPSMHRGENAARIAAGESPLSSTPDNLSGSELRALKQKVVDSTIHKLKEYFLDPANRQESSNPGILNILASRLRNITPRKDAETVAREIAAPLVDLLYPNGYNLARTPAEEKEIIVKQPEILRFFNEYFKANNIPTAKVGRTAIMQGAAVLKELIGGDYINRTPKYGFSDTRGGGRSGIGGYERLKNKLGTDAERVVDMGRDLSLHDADEERRQFARESRVNEMAVTVKKNLRNPDMASKDYFASRVGDVITNRARDPETDSYLEVAFKLQHLDSKSIEDRKKLDFNKVNEIAVHMAQAIYDEIHKGDSAHPAVSDVEYMSAVFIALRKAWPLICAKLGVKEPAITRDGPLVRIINNALDDITHRTGADNNPSSWRSDKSDFQHVYRKLKVENANEDESEDSEKTEEDENSEISQEPKTTDENMQKHNIFTRTSFSKYIESLTPGNKNEEDDEDLSPEELDSEVPDEEEEAEPESEQEDEADQLAAKLDARNVADRFLRSFDVVAGELEDDEDFEDFGSDDVYDPYTDEEDMHHELIGRGLYRPDNDEDETFTNWHQDRINRELDDEDEIEDEE